MRQLSSNLTCEPFSDGISTINFGRPSFISDAARTFLSLRAILRPRDAEPGELTFMRNGFLFLEV